MRLKIQKWGKSAAIRLPTELLNQVGLSIGDSIELSVLTHGLKLETSKPKYKLADLLAGIPNGMPMVEGWDSMQELGLEIINKD
jgi:antitoxin ChpS